MSMYSAIIMLPTGSTSAQAIAHIGDGAEFNQKTTAGGFTLMGKILSELEKDDLKAEILRLAPDTKNIILGAIK